ncbi:MAG: nitrilase-related carbon-nitrogen hydrolase [Candidatus Thorarchaeota archaeon]
MKETNGIRLGVGQIQPVVPKTTANLKKIEKTLDASASVNIDILVLPELANSGYVFNDRQEAMVSSEEIPGGETSQILREWSRKDRLIVCGICERDGDDLYNSAVGFGNGKMIGKYRKIHLFDNELDIFSAGAKEPPVINHLDFRYGMMICFDWAFPEVARILALKNAQVILHPANLVLPFCQKAMITRSIENRVFTATANRVGEERGVSFSGQSQITTPKGEVLVSLEEKETGVAFIDINPTEADNKMITDRNHVLKDRKPSLYSRVTAYDADL